MEWLGKGKMFFSAWDFMGVWTTRKQETDQQRREWSWCPKESRDEGDCAAHRNGEPCRQVPEGQVAILWSFLCIVALRLGLVLFYLSLAVSWDLLCEFRSLHAESRSFDGHMIVIVAEVRMCWKWTRWSFRHLGQSCRWYSLGFETEFHELILSVQWYFGKFPYVHWVSVFHVESMRNHKITKHISWITMWHA